MEFVWKLIFCVSFLFGNSSSWVNPVERPSLHVSPKTVTSHPGEMLEVSCEALNLPKDNALLWLQHKGNVITKLDESRQQNTYYLKKLLTAEDDGTEIFCRTAFLHSSGAQQLYNVKSHLIHIHVAHNNSVSKNNGHKSTNRAEKLTVTSLSKRDFYRVGDAVDFVCHADKIPKHTTLEWWQVNPHDELEYRQSASYTSEDFVLRKVLSSSDNNTHIFCRTMWLDNDTYFVRSNYHTLVVSDEHHVSTTEATVTENINAVDRRNCEMRSFLITVVFCTFGFFFLLILTILAVLYWMKRKRLLKIKLGRGKEMYAYNDITIPDTVCVLRKDSESSSNNS